MVRITQALANVKDGLSRWISPKLIVELCQAIGYTWRNGPLNPVVTVQLFIMQVLHGNTAINHLRQLANMRVTASAFCQARKRLPLELFERLTAALTRALIGGGAEVGRWRGHRVWHLDATGFSMPDEPALQARFGQPGGQARGCGFPVAKLLVLCDAATGLIARTLALPLRTHEMAHAAAMHDALRAGDLLVGDRALCSFAHFALVLMRDLQAVFRVHQRVIVSFRRGRKHARQSGKGQRAGQPTSQWLRWLGPGDQLVRYFKPQQCPRWCEAQQFAAMPASIVLRELRYRVSQPGFRTRSVTLVTTLVDAQKYPREEVARQYGQRWEIETHLRELKITMGMDVLHCKSADGVLKELAVFVLVYNLVRWHCLQAAHQQGVAADRISFIDALRWLRQGVASQPLIVNPPRPGRFEPRVIKRRMKEYRLMQKPRAVLREELMKQSLAA